MTEAPPLVDAGLAGELAGLRHEVEHLRLAMASRATIEQAKGIVMLMLGCDADTAFATMVDWSQRSNVKLRTVATDLVSAVSGGQSADVLSPELKELLAEQRIGPGRAPG